MLNLCKASLASAWFYSRGRRGQYRKLAVKTAVTEQNALSSESCHKLRKKLDDICDDHAHERVWKDPHESDIRVIRFEQDIPELIPELDLPSKLAAIEGYTGRPARHWFLMGNRLNPKKGNLGSGGGLHRDSPFTHQIKFIWYLSRVTSQSGPFRYLPGSNGNLWRDRDKFPLGETRFPNLKSDELVEVLGGPGTLLACDTKCIHGGKPIIEGTRYAITLYTFASAQSLGRSISGLGLTVK